GPDGPAGRRPGARRQARIPGPGPARSLSLRDAGKPRRPPRPQPAPGAAVRPRPLLREGTGAAGPAVQQECRRRRRAAQVGAVAAFARMGADPVVEDANHVLGWIKRKGVVSLTRKEIFDATRSRFQRVDRLLPALDLLVAHRVLRQQPGNHLPGPGRPSVSYDVNPAVHAQNP